MAGRGAFLLVKRTSRTGWRQPLRVGHEWLGLVCLVGVLVIAVTGAAIPFLGTLFELQYGDMLVVPEAQRGQPAVSVDRLVGSAVEGYGAAFSPQGVLMPHSRMAVDVALVYGVPQGAAGSDPLMLAVNPHTGAYQGSFWLDEAWGHELVHLHADLLAGETGRLVVVGLGLAMVFFTLTGLYLWWPRKGSALRKLTATTFRRRRPTLFLLHGLLGVWLGPLLLYYSVTGIATAKPAWFAPAMTVPFTQGPASLPNEGAPGELISLSQAVALAGEEFTERRLASFNFAHAGALVGMTFKSPGDLDHFYGDGYAWVDRRSGRVLESFVAAEHSLPVATGAAMHSLHAGFFFGIPGVITTVITGIGLAASSILGAILWWRRRSLRGMSREDAALGAGTPRI